MAVLDDRFLREEQKAGSDGDVGAIIHYALSPTHKAREHGNDAVDALVWRVNRSQGVMNYGPYEH